MNNDKTGGPAFPQTEVDRDGLAVTHQTGMTLRDYFAAKAMQGLLVGTKTGSATVLATDSYKIADAMLKAREA
jgi:hypothetical protein